MSQPAGVQGVNLVHDKTNIQGRDEHAKTETQKLCLQKQV